MKTRNEHVVYQGGDEVIQYTVDWDQLLPAGCEMKEHRTRKPEWILVVEEVKPRSIKFTVSGLESGKTYDIDVFMRAEGKDGTKIEDTQRITIVTDS